MGSIKDSIELSSSSSDFVKPKGGVVQLLRGPITPFEHVLSDVSYDDQSDNTGFPTLPLIIRDPTTLYNQHTEDLYL